MTLSQGGAPGGARLKGGGTFREGKKGAGGQFGGVFLFCFFFFGGVST